MREFIWWMVSWLSPRIGEEGGGADVGAGGGGADSSASGSEGTGGDGGADGGDGGDGAAGGGQGAAQDGSGGNGDQPASLLDAVKQSLKQPAEKSAQQADQVQKLPGQDQSGKPQQPQQDDDPTKMPEGLTPDAQRRFKSLVSKLKEKDTAVESEQQAHQQTRETLDGFRQLLGEARSTPQQFQAALSIIGLVNSGDPARMRQARDFMLSQARELSLQLGEALPDGSSDILAEFPDLQQEVAAMRMTEGRAIELARFRRAEANRTAQEQAARDQQQQQTQSQQQMREAGNAAVAQIDALAKKWAATDLDYKLKEAKILERLPDIMKSMAPQYWAAAIQQVYDALSVGATLTQQPAAAAPRTPRPLGGGNGGPSGAQAAPRNMLEAISRGIRRPAA